MHSVQRLLDHGLTQAEIARLLGCSQSTVSAWLKEVRSQQTMVDQEAVGNFTRSVLRSR
ncbi:helix-turn-helix domain-containing protein [Aeromonas caviae]